MRLLDISKYVTCVRLWPKSAACQGYMSVSFKEMAPQYFFRKVLEVS